jgi:hypothetical protein
MQKMAAFFAFIFMAVLMTGCATTKAEMPDDFALTFSWNTGTLPPRYRYDYVITIGPGAQGEFDFVPGYGDENDANRWVTSFDVTQEDLRALYAYFRDQGFFDARWGNNDLERIGGSTTSLILTAFGKNHPVPSISALDGANLSKVEDAQDFIRQFVPDAVWDEMDFRQTAFEASQSD